MPLPRGDEYYQAIQNPKSAFSDSVLQNCRVETNPLGLPKPYAGGFTTTYRLLNSSNSWAVRCFTREISDLSKRYQAIGTFLSKNQCDRLVEAKYLTNGIKVNGIFHPIIKMKWLDGEPLNNYIGKVYTNKSILNNLLSDFLTLIKTLESFGIAHGDLQHGNIIVKSNKQYLIDYDGMFFPDLSSLRVNELGHPNFQHPKRSTLDYNKNIDRFSAIVIYIAIKALTVVPSLWAKYDNGDNLLFKGKDFADPQNSKLIKELLAYAELSSLANNLISVCFWDFYKIPSLSEFISSTYKPPITVTPGKVIIRSPYPVIDAFQQGRLAEYFGQKVVVVGQISISRSGFTTNGNPYLFLNFGVFPNQTLTIVLWKEALAEFRKNGINPSNFVDKYVSITGVLGSYKGKPQISIDYSNQIQMLSGENEAEQMKSDDSKSSIQTPIKKPNIVLSNKSDFDSVLNEIYKTRPVTPKTTVTTSQVPKPTYYSTSKPSTSYKTSTSSKSSSISGCTVGIIITVIGGIIGVLTVGDASGFVGGAIFGGMIGTLIGWIMD